MAFAEIEIARIKRAIGPFCQARTPAHIAAEYRLEYTIHRHDVTLQENRPHWSDPTERLVNPVAKFKFVRVREEWRLYWMRADLKWHSYQPFAASPSLEKLLEVVAQDPHACFFG